MKTKYEEPHIEVNILDYVDVITTSGETGVKWDNDWSDALKQF